MLGILITCTLYKMFPKHQLSWSVISVVLAFSPFEKDARQVAYDRMKANIIGSAAGLLIFTLHFPGIYLPMVLGAFITILARTSLNILSTVRSALAAVIIVLFYEEDNAAFQFAVERAICVCIGCLVALLLTLLFDVLFYRYKRRSYIRKAKVMKKHYLHHGRFEN
jgi:uncharacterized membrane protein YccC